MWITDSTVTDISIWTWDNYLKYIINILLIIHAVKYLNIISMKFCPRQREKQTRGRVFSPSHCWLIKASPWRQVGIIIAQSHALHYAKRYNVSWWIDLVTYVNGGDGRVSNHVPDVVYFSSGRPRRRGGRQHHFASHPREPLPFAGRTSPEIIAPHNARSMTSGNHQYTATVTLGRLWKHWNFDTTPKHLATFFDQLP